MTSVIRKRNREGEVASGKKSQESSLESAFDAREVVKEGAAMKTSATCRRRWAPEDKRDPSRGARSDE